MNVHVIYACERATAVEAGNIGRSSQATVFLDGGWRKGRGATCWCLSLESPFWQVDPDRCCTYDVLAKWMGVFLRTSRVCWGRRTLKVAVKVVEAVVSHPLMSELKA